MEDIKTCLAGAILLTFERYLSREYFHLINDLAGSTFLKLKSSRGSVPKPLLSLDHGPAVENSILFPLLLMSMLIKTGGKKQFCGRTSCIQREWSSLSRELIFLSCCSLDLLRDPLLPAYNF